MMWRQIMIVYVCYKTCSNRLPIHGQTLGKLKNLQKLELGHNHLSGPIPKDRVTSGKSWGASGCSRSMFAVKPAGAGAVEGVETSSAQREWAEWSHPTRTGAIEALGDFVFGFESADRHAGNQLTRIPRGERDTETMDVLY